MKIEKNIFDDLRKDNTSALGEKMLSFMPKSKAEVLKDNIKALREEATSTGLNITNSVLFSSVVATFIEEKMRPKLLANDVIKQISLDIKGFKSIQIPIRSDLITAKTLGTDGALVYDDGEYDTETISTSYIYASNRLTWELINYASVDLIANELYEIGYALANKIDSDIVSAIDDVCKPANSNIKYLGGSEAISYASLIDGYYGLISNYGEPNIILTNPKTAGTLMKLTQFVSAFAFGTLYNPTEVFRPVQVILGCKFLVSTQVGQNDLYFIDSDRTGYLVMANTGVETFDGRLSGYLAFEVAGAVSYGVGIVQPKSVYKIKENTAKPTGTAEGTASPTGTAEGTASPTN